MRMLAGLARFSEEHFASCAQLLPPRDALTLLVASASAGCWSMASVAALSAARDFHSLRVEGALDDLPQVRSCVGPANSNTRHGRRALHRGGVMKISCVTAAEIA